MTPDSTLAVTNTCPKDGVHLCYRVVARVGDRRTGPRPTEKRFPADTVVRVMKRWQEDQRAELRRQDLRPARGTLADDVEQYLRLVKPRLVSFKDR